MHKMNIIEFREKVSATLWKSDWFEEAFPASVISVYMRKVGDEIVKYLSISLK